jgi:hypothetical protein
MKKRCCHLGCTREKTGDEGYRVGFGFMLWACPEHAEVWRLFDKENRAYEQKMSEEYEKALEAFEREWDENFQQNNPRPVPPPLQPSE